ncbi:ankyrin repeat domain-containing protein [bacterium]|nr:ankyrin repeat domain-containing protein [bacterium]
MKLASGMLMWSAIIYTQMRPSQTLPIGHPNNAPLRPIQSDDSLPTRRLATTTLDAPSGTAHSIDELSRTLLEIVDIGVPLTTPMWGGWTPGTQAAVDGDIQQLHRLNRLDPASLKESDVEGWTPATRAASVGQVESIMALFEIDPLLLRQVDNFLATPATRAAHYGQTTILETLHRLDPELLSQIDAGGWTPATRAVFDKQHGVLETLFRLNRTILTQPNGKGWTPATLAVAFDKGDIVNTLYRLDPQAVTCSDANGWTPAMWAANDGKVAGLRRLHSLHPETITRPDSYGRTTATRAAANGHSHVLQLLFELAPEIVRHPDVTGWSVGTIAIRHNQGEILQTLHALDPRLLSQPDGHQFTPLTFAIHEKKMEMITTLYQINPSLIDTLTPDGLTPVSFDSLLELMNTTHRGWGIDPWLAISPLLLISQVTVGVLSLIFIIQRLGRGGIPNDAQTNLSSEPIGNELVADQSHQLMTQLAELSDKESLNVGHGMVARRNGSLYELDDATGTYQPVACLISHDELTLHTAVLIHRPTHPNHRLHLVTAENPYQFAKCALCKEPTATENWLHYYWATRIQNSIAAPD